MSDIIDDVIAEIDFEFLFRDDVTKRFRDFHQKRSNLVEKHIGTLKSIQVDESSYFWQEIGHSNSLTFVYWCQDKIDEAHEQSTKSLEHNASNLNALLGHMLILAKLRQSGQCMAVIERYNSVKRNPQQLTTEKLICAGEMAFVCSFLDPSFYMEAIERYEKLLSEYEYYLAEGKVSANDLHNGVVSSWRYHLARTYNRMLNRGSQQRLLKRHTIEEVFEKISKFLRPVIDSDDDFYKAKAMTELADAFKKCDGDTDGNVTFPYSDTPIDEFYAQAMEIAREHKDAHVLEKCGRERRSAAETNEQLLEAIEIFKCVLDISPHRHVSWHQLGQAHLSLWHIAEGHEEGKAERCRNDRIKVSFAGAISSTLDSGLAKDTSTVLHTECRPTTFVKECCDSMQAPFTPHIDSTTTDSAIGSNRLVSLSKSCSVDEQISTGSRPISRFLSVPGSVPMQHESPTEYDTRSVSNPRVVDKKESDDFLRKAKECFEKAAELSKCATRRYLIDLARSCISLGLYSEAEKNFVKADNLGYTSAVDDNDWQYLYEQWGLMRHETAKDDELKDVMDLYRTSIRAAMRAKVRSRMAYYKLRDILKAADRNTNNFAQKLEYDVLFDRNRETTKGVNLTEVLRENSGLQKTVWKMLDILYERNHDYDASTAFTYLTALHEAGMLNLEQSGNRMNQGVTAIRRQMVVEVARRVIYFDSRSTNSARSHDILRETFRWLIGTKTLSQRGFHDVSKNKHSYDVCVLSPQDLTPGTERLINLLTKHCRLSVAMVFTEGNGDDVQLGQNAFDVTPGLLACSRSVIVVEDSADNNWGTLTALLKPLLALPAAPAFLVRHQTVDRSGSYGPYLDQLACFVLNDECNDDCLALSLFSSIFLPSGVSTM